MNKEDLQLGQIHQEGDFMYIKSFILKNPYMPELGVREEILKQRIKRRIVTTYATESGISTTDQYTGPKERRIFQDIYPIGDCFHHLSQDPYERVWYNENTDAIEKFNDVNNTLALFGY